MFHSARLVGVLHHITNPTDSGRRRVGIKLCHVGG